METGEDGRIERQTHADGGDHRRFLGALAYGLIFWVCYIAYAHHLGMTGNDFGVFHRAAREPLDSVYALREANPFAYPPTTLLWLKPLSLLDRDMGFAIWIALSIGALGWASLRLAGPRVALLVVASPALATTIVIGQFGALVGAMILFAVSLRGWRQGLLLGLAATIKPQMLLAAPLLLLARRDWRALLGAGFGAGASVLAELMLLGPHLWLDWLRALKAFPKAVERADAYAGAVSPAGVASYFHLPPWPFLAVGATLAVMLLWKRARVADRIELAALMIIASALMSPYLLVYDLAVMMPFVADRMIARNARVGTPALAAFLSPFAGLSLFWIALSLLRRDGAPTGDAGRIEPVDDQRGAREQAPRWPLSDRAAAA